MKATIFLKNHINGVEFVEEFDFLYMTANSISTRFITREPKKIEKSRNGGDYFRGYVIRNGILYHDHCMHSEFSIEEEYADVVRFEVHP